MSEIKNIAYILTNETNYLNIISIFSLLKTNKNDKFNIFLFYDKYFQKDLLKNFAFLEQYSNCEKIEYKEIPSNKTLLKTGNYNFSYIFILAELLETCDKLLLLSPISIINEDISDLYNIDLSQNSCAATCLVDTTSIVSNIRKDISKNNIYRTLIVLMNLKLWREREYYKKFLDIQYNFYSSQAFKSNNNEYFFNLILDDCKEINLKYNYTELWYARNNEIFFQTVENKKNYTNLLMHIEKPTIITFAGPKPIEVSCRNSYTNIWWKYAEKTPVYNEIKQFREVNKYKLKTTTAQNSFNYAWLLSRIFPYIKPYWFRILLGFGIAIPLGLLDGVTAFALKPYMDYVVGGKAFAYNWHGLNLSISSLQMAFIIPAGVILFAIVQGVLRYLNGYLSTWTSQKITNDVKFDLFERLIHMHPQFFDDNSSGVVISRYMGDPKTASAGIVDNIKTITTSLFGALGLIAVMLYSSWKLAFIGILVLCVAFIPVILIRKRIKEASNKNMVIGSNITTNINETYSGNKIMAAYELQDRQNKYFKEQTLESFNINMSLYKRSGWMSPLMYLIASSGIATVLGVGTYLINCGEMTAGSFASFVTSLLLLYKPVKTLGNTLTGIQNIFVAMGRVFELFDLTPAIKDCENPKTLNGFENSIEFKDVCFEYVPNQPVLRNINLTIPMNETLAIVGNSGGGKSTLVNLIPRFYDIKSGSIKIDGVDIREFSLKSLRQNISMVFQDNFLYSGTIKENIMMGNPDATTEELMGAIKSAHLQDLISELPEGLETELGERGMTLSGGQRQRVAIARAMLRNAPIVILDEATSALDNESEAIVQKAMDNLMQNRTVFIIAHRLSTIKNANRIAVINEGHLVELGTPEELMSIEHGQYKALYEMQFKKAGGIERV